MEEAFQDLLRLIEEAEIGQEQGCLVTTRAYLRLAEKAARQLVRHAVNDEEEKRLATGCAFSERHCFRTKTWDDVVSFMRRFWDGFECGFFERTQPSRQHKQFQIGYRLGRHGK